MKFKKELFKVNIDCLPNGKFSFISVKDLFNNNGKLSIALRSDSDVIKTVNHYNVKSQNTNYGTEYGNDVLIPIFKVGDKVCLFESTIKDEHKHMIVNRSKLQNYSNINYYNVDINCYEYKDLLPFNGDESDLSIIIDFLVDKQEFELLSSYKSGNIKVAEPEIESKITGVSNRCHTKMNYSLGRVGYAPKELPNNDDIINSLAQFLGVDPSNLDMIPIEIKPNKDSSEENSSEDT